MGLVDMVIKPGMKIAVACPKRPPTTFTVTRIVRPGVIAIRQWAFGKEYGLLYPPGDDTQIIPLYQ